MAQRLQIRRDTQTAWETTDPILSQGELGWQLDGTATLKIGNGTDIWSLLPNLLGGGSGGTALSIPQPQISSRVHTSLTVHFLPWIDNTWQSLNPEIFLMRWSPGPTESRRSPSTIITTGRHWVHPSNTVTPTKWAGWKWFGGQQKIQLDSEPTPTVQVLSRETEWDLPANLYPYHRIDIPFNRFMFWKRKAGPQADMVDQELIDIPLTDMNTQWIQTQSNNRGYGGIKHHRRRQKFCLVVAIDNPAATQTNGLCPKMFGPMSQPFYTFASSIKPSPGDPVVMGTVSIGTSIDRNRTGVPQFNV